ncbi:MAG: rod shape-determining protein MreC [Candidatus Binataceae bacterium]
MKSSFLWRNRVVLTSGLLLLFALHMLSVGVGPRNWAASPQEFLMLILSPVQSASARLVEGAQVFWRDYVDLVSVQHQNQELRARLDHFQTERAHMAELEVENRHLSNLLELREALRLKAIAASVIGSDAAGLSRTLILGQGSKSGLRAGMAVLSEQGVVGKLIAVSPNSSRVLLLVDHNAALDALDQRSRVRGIVAGVVDDGLMMKYVGRTDDIKPGDTVVTSGMDGVFSRGLLIGHVSRIEREGPGLFLKIAVKPAVNFRDLEQVMVVTEPAPRVISTGDKGGE